MYNYAQQRAAQKMPSKKDDCLRQPACFLYNQAWHFLVRIEDNANTTSQTSTTYYTNTCFKLTIVTHLSFSERIAIANLSYNYVFMYCTIAHNVLWYCSMTPTIYHKVLLLWYCTVLYCTVLYTKDRLAIAILLARRRRRRGRAERRRLR